jgi:hypothetical protein
MTARPAGLDPLLQIERDVTCGIRLEFEGRRLKPKFICQVCAHRGADVRPPFERAGQGMGDRTREESPRLSRGCPHN